MIIINQYSGRFGNQIIHYFNLRQLANFLGHTYYAKEWDGNNLFDILNTGEYIQSDEDIHVDGKQILSMGLDNFHEKYHNIKNNVILDITLGDLFYKFNQLSTYDIFKFKNYKPNKSNKIKVGIHFRGTDFNVWNDGLWDESLESSYP